MKTKLSHFAIPYVVWMAIFVVAPIIIMVVYAFSDGAGGATLDNFVQMGGYAEVFRRSFKLAIIATVICLLIGYPVSYLMSREGAAFQRIAMVLIMLPMWINFLLRTYSWMTILENNGLLNQLFQKIGLIALYNSITGSSIEFFPMMDTQGAVVLGMVYNYLPFMILPIYSVIGKMDRSLLEAARDLGANSVRCSARSFCPCPCRAWCRASPWCSCHRCPPSPSAGCWAAARSCCWATSSSGSFWGVPTTHQLGAAISLVMMVIVLVCMLVMNRFGEGEEQAVML